MHATQPTANYIQYRDFSSTSSPYVLERKTTEKLDFRCLPPDGGSIFLISQLSSLEVKGSGTDLHSNQGKIKEADLYETDSFQTMLASESALAEDWNQPEEDIAWANL
jgi:hypothetical protein